tara:strand:+ start:357 stop:572 length:216 start_codon:yes stop_codon:yes gene_type:complete
MTITQQHLTKTLEFAAAAWIKELTAVRLKLDIANRQLCEAINIIEELAVVNDELKMWQEDATLAMLECDCD